MRFTAAKSDLQNAVSTVIRAVPSHTTMTILECILIEARNNLLIMTANDMEMGIETHIHASVEEEGVIALDAKLFSEIVRKFPDDRVYFESDSNHQVLIRSGKARFQIGGREGEEFPELPSIERDESVTLSQLTLKSLIQDTIFSTASGENNKIMTGELFEIRGDILRIAALDGHRIAMRRVAIRGNYQDRRVIVPGKTLTDISRILSGEMDDLVNLFFARNHIVFEIPGTIVVSRLIDGDYFNVDQMMSSDYDTKITVNRALLMGCVDRASLFVREGDKKPIIVEVEDQEMKLSIDSPMGSMNEELDIEKEGKDLVIGFNPRFIMDALKAVSDENVTLYLLNPRAPLIMRDDDQSYTYLILPVNFTR